MATSAWRFFRPAKQLIASGAIDLNADTMTLHLYASGSNITALTQSTKASITSELTAGAGGYTTDGFDFGGAGTVTFSGSVVTWDLSDIVVTASGGDLSQVRFALIEHSNIPVCYSELSTGGFNVTSGNTLTIQMATSGIFELSGGET